MIALTNNQKVPLDIKQFEQDAQTILNHLGYGDFDLGILITDNKTIHAFNETYRGKDKPTDILSFPFHPELKAGEQIAPETEDDKNLGDIIISPEYVKADLEQWGQSFEQRMSVLLVHGICHLLGYDHIEDADYEVMKKKEEELLALLQS
ncbi:MAG: C21orf57 isoform A protein [uncultured bacterium]|nr:MAG: C21orf57 isoform A protein [uncultured bacterium]HLE76415.1 rRNA maturation RNase YbeY [Candidatus Babeliales bacterium]